MSTARSAACGSCSQSPKSRHMRARAASLCQPCHEGARTRVRSRANFQFEFFEANMFLASITSAPYSFTWNAVPVGSHTIRAVATGAHGRVGISKK